MLKHLPVIPLWLHLAINLGLLIVLIITAFYLISIRFEARLQYSKLATLRNTALDLNKEYTKLQLEEGTYSSGLILEDLAIKKLGFITPDKQHIVELK